MKIITNNKGGSEVEIEHQGKKGNGTGIFPLDQINDARLMLADWKKSISSIFYKTKPPV